MKKSPLMVRLVTFTFIAITALLTACGNAQTQNNSATQATIKTNLSATEFDAKLKELPAAPIVDVRSPEEFAKGHLANALNYNINDGNFMDNINKLDKSKPVFVYCLSGGRSSSAAQRMRSEGFKEVYEMEGGMMRWRAANLPETTANTVVSTGITKQQFDNMLNTNKIVLVDFYADWCAPCKKMKPYLDEIAVDMAATVEVVRINADDNQQLCKDLKVDALPVLQVYNSKTLTWNNIGFVEKEEVLKHLK